MRKATLFLAATVFLLFTGPAVLAEHQANHNGPRACEVSEGAAPYMNPHCNGGYPPGQVQKAQRVNQAGKKANFEFTRQTEGAITVGMLIVAGLGAFTVLLAARAVVRRRLIS
jgi:hypothetical protein